MKRIAAECVVVGAGPAGMSAAIAFGRERGSRRKADRLGVLVLDENGSAGGQIWRGNRGKQRSWELDAKEAGVEHRAGATVMGVLGPRVLLVEIDGAGCAVEFESLVIATGARELFLPFPGWTLPGVTGAGGLQAMVKGGLEVRGKRVVVAGSGPLLPVVAAFLARQGAKVMEVAEQAAPAQVSELVRRMWRSPGKAIQGAGLRIAMTLAGTPYRPGNWVARVVGKERLEGVVLSDGELEREVACDFLACSYGLTPNTQLAEMMGCRLQSGRLVVDEGQRTSVDGVWGAGEVCGIGGVEAALYEGTLAGLGCAGVEGNPARGDVDRARRFAAELDRAFALRPEVLALGAAETILCRCEDVTLGRVRECGSWREAKVQTRCGMGPCQGRICGAAARVVLGFAPSDARPPIVPVRMAVLGDLQVGGDGRMG